MNGIGLFGGTFNPLHTAHLKVAEDVRKRFFLEKIYFIPSALPPHKGTGNLADAEDRYQMIAGAIAGCPDFAVSDVEIRRQGFSYSIDTVLHFKKQLTASMPCFLIIGMDAFLEFDTWKTYQSFFDLIPMIIMTRPDGETPSQMAPPDILERFIHTHVNPDYEFSLRQSAFMHPEKQTVHLCRVTPMDISSTKIRNCIKQGLPITGMVPESVEHYIYEKGLYL